MFNMTSMSIILTSVIKHQVSLSGSLYHSLHLCPSLTLSFSHLSKISCSLDVSHYCSRDHSLTFLLALYFSHSLCLSLSPSLYLTLSLSHSLTHCFSLSLSRFRSLNLSHSRSRSLSLSVSLFLSQFVSHTNSFFLSLSLNLFISLAHYFNSVIPKQLSL